MFRWIILTVLAGLFVCFGVQAAAAAPFQNLGFEGASIGNASPGAWLTTPQALPHWTASVAGTVPSSVGYDNMALDGCGIFMQDGLYAPFPLQPLQGSYSVMLQDPSIYSLMQRDGSLSPWPWPSTCISQTGDIPGTARSLWCLADYPFGSANWSAYHLVVSLNGAEIPMNNVPGSTLYKGDISAFAGQTAELQFALLLVGAQSNAPAVLLDGIQFSNEPVPEPSALGLFAMGGIAVAGCARRPRV